MGSEALQEMLLATPLAGPSAMLLATLLGMPSVTRPVTLSEMLLVAPLAMHWAEPREMPSLVPLVASSERSRSLQPLAKLLLVEMQPVMPP